MGLLCGLTGVISFLLQVRRDETLHKTFIKRIRQTKEMGNTNANGGCLGSLSR